MTDSTAVEGRDKGDNPFELLNINDRLSVCECTVALVHHTHTFTSQQICQPGRRGQCCGSEASPHCVAASGPSDGWRWRPASPAPLRGPTLTGCRWAHPLCPPNAWKKGRTKVSNRSRLKRNTGRENRQMQRLKAYTNIYYLSLLYFLWGSNSNPSAAHQIISPLM